MLSPVKNYVGVRVGRLCCGGETIGCYFSIAVTGQVFNGIRFQRDKVLRAVVG